MRIACIGSREVTKEEEAVMEEIGAFIVKRGWWLATGNALGSDAAYARGANRVDPHRVMLYLPWKGYNQELIHPLNRVLENPDPEWEALAKLHHPAWDHLKQGARKMMLRNAGIIRRADAVIAVLNPKPGGGGTGHGWRIALAMGIPAIDLRMGLDWRLFLEQVAETV